MAKLATIGAQDANRYATLPPDQRKAAALEMAEEIRTHDAQMSELAMAIQNYIDPHHNGEPDPAPKGEDAEIRLTSAKHLINLLVENISNSSQQRRLIECLESM